MRATQWSPVFGFKPMVASRPVVVQPIDASGRISREPQPLVMPPGAILVTGQQSEANNIPIKRNIITKNVSVVRFSML
jgi:hypothetical protein